MSTRKFVVDEAGEAWLLGSLEAYERFQGEWPSDDPVTISRHGFVVVRFTGDIAELQFAPGKVGPATMTGTIRLLYENRPVRVRLSYVKGGQSINFVGNRGAALDRFEELLAPGITQTGRRIPKTELVRPEDFGRAEFVPAIHILEAWGRHNYVWTNDFMDELDRMGRSHHVLVARQFAGSERLLVEKCGLGYSFVNEAWRPTLAPGKEIEDQPDETYARWVGETYRRTIRFDGPQLEKVDALVKAPNLPLRRVRYARLLLPWRGSGRDRLVSSVGIYSSSTILE